MAGSNGYEISSNKKRSIVLISLPLNDVTHDLDEIERIEGLEDYRREGPRISEERNGLEMHFIYVRN